MKCASRSVEFTRRAYIEDVKARKRERASKLMYSVEVVLLVLLIAVLIVLIEGDDGDEEDNDKNCLLVRSIN